MGVTSLQPTQTKVTSKPHQSSTKPQQSMTSPTPPARQTRRKRRGHGWTRKKTYKLHPANYLFDPLRRYKIRGILEEKDGQYHVKWARTDPRGKDFEDSWVPMREFEVKGRKYANNAAVRDWARRKAQGREKEFNDAPGEYDTEGEEYVTEASEDELEASLK